MNLMDDLEKNEPKPQWKRKENEFNTQFTYEELDNSAHLMIEESMRCLKELFPYALLFNPKLSELEVVNETGGQKIKGFYMKKMESKTLHGLDIFNVEVTEEDKEPYIYSLASVEDIKNASIVAVPVKINGKDITLLETNHKYPKMFK